MHWGNEWLSQLHTQLKQLRNNSLKQKKNHDWPGFEPMISAMPVQRSIFQFSSAFLLIFRPFRSLGIFLKSYLVKGEVSRFASALDSLVVEVLVSRLFSSNSALLAHEVCHSASFAGLRSLSFFNHSSWFIQCDWRSLGEKGLVQR